MARSPWWLPWAVYTPLAALGALVSYLSRGAILIAPPSVRFAATARSALAIGLLAAFVVTALTVWSTRILVARARWAQRLYVTLRCALLGTPPARLAVLAGCAAVAEELFFRAALLPYVGVVLSSLLFGLLHVSSRDTYLGWMVWASLMGLVFAGLFLGSGSLLPPIVAHAAINYGNMQYLCRHDPTEADKHAVVPQRGRMPKV